MSDIYNEAFYTEEYDQEILDYLDINYKIGVGDRTRKYLRCGNSNGYFWFSSIEGQPSNNTLMTKQEFKIKIGMPFVDDKWKDITIDHKRSPYRSLMVELHNGNRYLAISEHSYIGEYGHMSKKALMGNTGDWGVPRVYSVTIGNGFQKALKLLCPSDELLWELPKKDLEIKALNRAIDVAQEQINIAKKALEVLLEEE